MKRLVWGLPDCILKWFRKPETLGREVFVGWAGAEALQVILRSSEPRLSCGLNVCNLGPLPVVIDRMAFEFTLGGTSVQGESPERLALKPLDFKDCWTNLRLNDSQKDTLTNHIARGNGRLSQSADLRLVMYCDSRIGSFVVERRQSFNVKDVKVS